MAIYGTKMPRCNRKIGINSKNEIYMIKSLTNKPFKKRCPQCKNKRKYSEHENILFIKVGNKRICKWCYERSLLFLKSISYILNKYLK
jgi:hypothetical protein